MTKEESYQNKMEQLNRWLPLIINAIRKDLKNEHLKNDPKFFKQHFSGKAINSVSIEDLSSVYSNYLTTSENAENLSEYMAHRWLLKNSEIYHFFENELVKIAEDFSKLEEIDQETSHKIIEGSSKEFGKANTYIFSILNSVVFHPTALEKLRQDAAQETQKQEEEKIVQAEAASWEGKIRTLEEQLARVTDKYEKKLSGMQKKYDTDVAALKKQVSNLQKKVSS